MQTEKESFIWTKICELYLIDSQSAQTMIPFTISCVFSLSSKIMSPLLSLFGIIVRCLCFEYQYKFHHVYINHAMIHHRWWQHNFNYCHHRRYYWSHIYDHYSLPVLTKMITLLAMIAQYEDHRHSVMWIHSCPFCLDYVHTHTHTFVCEFSMCTELPKRIYWYKWNRKCNTINFEARKSK